MGKNFKIILLLFSFIPFLYSCTNCSGSKGDNDSIKIISVDSLPGIEEAVGTIGEGTSMNVLEFISDNGDTVYINTPGDLVTGGGMSGDRVSVVYYVNGKENLASVVVNLTSLQHLWTQKGADGHEQSLELDANGVAVTYNMRVEYNSWEVKDGLLLLHSPKKVASEGSEIVDSFHIMSLTDEQLVLANHNIETVFELDN